MSHREKRYLLFVGFVLTCQSALRELETDSAQAFGLEKRTPWTESHVRGRPDPPLPFRAENALPGIAFRQPTVLTSAPGTDRWFVAEHSGQIFSTPMKRDGGEPKLMLDVNNLVQRANDAASAKDQVRLVAVYGMTFHPRFEQNGYCYVCYVIRWNERGRGQHPHGTRVVRLRVDGSDPPVCDVESEHEVITWLQGGHNGGCIKFGADGFLYISTGDGGFAFPPDGRNAGQDVSNLLSAVLRIDVDHADGGRNYSIPGDNPFVKLSGARGEIWSYGMRNPWKISFDSLTGELWVGDVGWELWELIYRVRKGDNFGWSLVEGRQPVHTERRRGPTPIVSPAVEIPHTDAASITGGFVYRGKKYPELVGKYIFGDWETRRVWGVQVERDQVGPRRELVEPTVRVVGFAEDADGELFMLDYDDGTIQRLVRNSPSEQHRFPRTLSETGLFDSVENHIVAKGILPFSINAQQWSDGAVAQRWLAVPGDEPVLLHANRKAVVGSMFKRRMDFPTDTVLMKTLSLSTTYGDPSSQRRIETQLLHFDGRQWLGYSYRWNDDQTDAELVNAAGETIALEVVDARIPSGRRAQQWKFASRTDCIRCHNPWAEHTLAFNVPQINREHGYAGVAVNQIDALRNAGWLKDVIEQAEPDNPYAKPEQPSSWQALPRLADPDDTSLALADRGRAYLHANCAHCHRDGGGGSARLHLPFDTPLNRTEAFNVRPTQGAFAIPDARIIAPGDPYRSVLYFRMAKLGSGHMPHLGAKQIDSSGLALIHDWIRSLPVRLNDQVKIDRLTKLDEPAVLLTESGVALQTRWRIAKQIAAEDGREQIADGDYKAADRRAAEQAKTRAEQRSDERTRLLTELLGMPPSAMLLARAIRENRLPDFIKRAAIIAASKTESTEVRDLFEPFLPDEQRTKRLGDNIRAEEILKLAGNEQRGRKLFHQSAKVRCRSCHRIGNDGISLGPDLSEIGRKLDRERLLESILQPSKNIDPKYVIWLVETKAGKLASGLLVRRDVEQIVLKDVDNKQLEFSMTDVENVIPYRKSMMPDLLFRDLSAQQAADLIEYLASLKTGEATPSSQSQRAESD